MKGTSWKQNGKLRNDCLIKVRRNVFFLYDCIFILEFPVSCIDCRTSKTVRHLVVYEYFSAETKEYKRGTVRLPHMHLKCSTYRFIG